MISGVRIMTTTCERSHMRRVVLRCCMSLRVVRSVVWCGAVRCGAVRCGAVQWGGVGWRWGWEGWGWGGLGWGAVVYGWCGMVRWCVGET